MMKPKPATLKKSLLSIVRGMSLALQPFVRNPKKDFTRKRKLSFEFMMLTLLRMGGGSIANELMAAQGYSPGFATTSAFVQQRDKILPDAFEHLFHQFQPKSALTKRFKGYRLLAIDGCTLHIPTNTSDTQNLCQTSDKAKPYNLMHLNALFDLCNNAYVDALIFDGRSPNEYRAFANLVHRSDIKKAIILADRGFESYNCFAHAQEKGWKFLIRVKDICSLRGVMRGLQLPDTPEFDVDIKRTLTSKNNKTVKQSPHIYKHICKNTVFDFRAPDGSIHFPISLRFLRFPLPGGGYESVATNLPRSHFSPSDIRDLYYMRWGIETSFRTLKYYVGLNIFHSKKAEYIKQEIFAALIMYNFSSFIAPPEILPTRNTKYQYKVSFASAIHICREFIRGHIKPPNVLPLILSCVSPVKEGRSFSRKTRTAHTQGFNYRVS